MRIHCPFKSLSENKIFPSYFILLLLLLLLWKIEKRRSVDELSPPPSESLFFTFANLPNIFLEENTEARKKVLKCVNKTGEKNRLFTIRMKEKNLFSFCAFISLKTERNE